MLYTHLHFPQRRARKLCHNTQGGGVSNRERMCFLRQSTPATDVRCTITILHRGTVFYETPKVGFLALPPPPPQGRCFNFHSGRGGGSPLDPLPPCLGPPSPSPPPL